MAGSLSARSASFIAACSFVVVVRMVNMVAEMPVTVGGNYGLCMISIVACICGSANGYLWLTYGEGRLILLAW